MKNLIKITAALFLVVAFSFNSKAQFGASVGLEVALPLGDFGNLASFGTGISAGGEFAIGDNIGLTAQIGYIYLLPADGLKSAYTMPMQAGFKYYFDSNESGFYGHGQIGVHTTGVTTDDFEFFGVTVPGVSSSSTDLSYAFGAGYLVSENIDLGARYNMIAGDGSTLSYISIRAAYNF